jgi:hypothetical protein
MGRKKDRPLEANLGDERPTLPGENVLRKDYFPRLGLSDTTKVEPLTLFMVQQVYLRDLAARWVKQNAVKTLDKSRVNKLVKTLLPEMPTLPVEVQTWLATVQKMGKAATLEAMPPKLVALKEQYEREQRTWLQKRNHILWKEHQLLAAEPALLPDEETLPWYRVEVKVPDWVLEIYALELGDYTPGDMEYVRSFSMQPAQTVDRSLRGPVGWETSDKGPPKFLDPSNKYVIEYVQEGLPLEDLNRAVMQLNSRRADVWRLITAACLEAWPEGQNQPEPVWIDVRELLEAMGFKKATNGGYRPEQRLEAAQSLHDINNLRIVIPMGTEIFPTDPKTGKRKPTKLSMQRKYSVINVTSYDEVKDTAENSYPLRWKIRPGDWIQEYPRQFAQLYRALIQLPAKSGTSSWAKAIGTELSYQYRQDRLRGPVKTLFVSTILERSMLLDEAKKMRNKVRVREYFESALDLLKEKAVCKTWQYAGDDVDKIDSEGGWWFTRWLNCRVNITAPDSIVAALPNTPHRQL